MIRGGPYDVAPQCFTSVLSTGLERDSELLTTLTGNEYMNDHLHSRVTLYMTEAQWLPRSRGERIVSSMGKARE